MELSRYTELFLSEAREHLSGLTRLLLHLESHPGDTPAVDEAFRAVHTLKGTAASMGYLPAADLAHWMESVLDGLRRQALQPDPDRVDLLLEGADAMELCIEQQAATGESPAAPAELLHRLQARAGSGEGAELGEQPGEPEPDAPGTVEGRVVRARIRFAPEEPLPAARAMLVLRAARALGDVARVEPAEARISAGECGPTLELDLRTEAEADVVAEALGACCGGVADAELLADAPAAEAQAAGPAAGEPVVRVRQSRLDSVVNHLGELVIARDRLRRTTHEGADPELEGVVEEVSALVDHLRHEVMRLRMVPLGEVFDRLPRVVRDAARKLDKPVRLEATGRDAELDRSLVNELNELLVHLLRNAVDHGIEAPEVRRAAGKPEQGCVRVSAAHERSAVVVRVEDDGGGMRRERILERAVGEGLISVSHGASMPDDEVYRLVLQPGFSTAERVTEVSGRGVGLDVVRSRLQALGGSLEIQSAPGTGTRFTMRLPLSLAIARVLHVEAAGEIYTIPVAAVVEVGEVDPQGSAQGGRTVEHRGIPLPLVRLAQLLDGGAAEDGRRMAPLVVAESGGVRFGVLVDALHGQREAVMKRFDAPAQMLHVFSGATLLEDGRPTLIVDVERLARYATAGSGRA